MEKKFRIYVSTPDPEPDLSEAQEKFFRAILKKVEGAGFQPHGFYEGGDSADFELNNNGMRDLMRICQGVLIFAFAQWQVIQRHGKEQPDEPSREAVSKSNQLSPTEYNHLEGGVAIAEAKPLLVITEAGVLKRGIASQTVTREVVTIPRGAKLSWLEQDSFKNALNRWKKKVSEHRHVFLGYSGKASATASSIELFLKDQKLEVLDWRRHFKKGETILEQVEQAARLCTCGIFLFTKDDMLAADEKTPAKGPSAAPRDNVVFEAGYFVRSRGKKRTLIILEDGAKFPVDLGGDIYLALKDRDNTSTIENSLRVYLEEVL